MNLLEQSARVALAAFMHDIGKLAERAGIDHAGRLDADRTLRAAHLSKLHKLLRCELGPAAGPYLISKGGSRPRRYSLGPRPAAVSCDILEAGLRG